MNELRIRALKKCIKEWRAGVDWPNEFDAIKWQLSEDPVCRLQKSCNDCVIYEFTGHRNCDPLISEALDVYDDWLLCKDGPAYDEWREISLRVVDFFESLLDFCQKTPQKLDV